MTVSGVKDYDVLVDGVVRATVSGTSATVSGLDPSTEYDVTVRARDNAGNVSAQSSVLAVTTSAGSGDVTPPSAPTALDDVTVGSTSATVTWTASTDNVAVTGYRVYVNGAQVGTTGATAFEITGLSAGTAYSVTVRAHDAAGNLSAASSTLSITTTGAPVVPEMVAQWLFAEGSGSSATDEVSSRVMAINGAHTWTSGPGSLGAIQVTADQEGGILTSLSGLQNSHRTIMGWARLDNETAEWRRTVAFRDGSTSPMLISARAASPYQANVYLRVRTGGVDNNDFTQPRQASGEWHHYALTHDGVTARYFLDGVEAASFAAAGSVDNAGEFRVAHLGGQTVADVRIYSTALTAGQILAVMGEA